MFQRLCLKTVLQKHQGSWHNGISTTHLPAAADGVEVELQREANQSSTSYYEQQELISFKCRSEYRCPLYVNSTNVGQ